MAASFSYFYCYHNSSKFEILTKRTVKQSVCAPRQTGKEAKVTAVGKTSLPTEVAGVTGRHGAGEIPEWKFLPGMMQFESATQALPWPETQPQAGGENHGAARLSFLLMGGAQPSSVGARSLCWVNARASMCWECAFYEGAPTGNCSVPYRNQPDGRVAETYYAKRGWCPPLTIVLLVREHQREQSCKDWEALIDLKDYKQGL